MSIFKEWWKKKELPLKPKPESEQQPHELEKPKTIVNVGIEVANEMEFSPEKSKELLQSLEQHEEYLLGSTGSLFVSQEEIEYFIKVMEKLAVRPVIIFDFNILDKPIDDLLKSIKQYNNRRPIVFVLNYYQEVADQKDSGVSFDSGLRDECQNEKWSVIIQGDRSAKGLGGNIFGSSRSSHMYVEERRLKRTS